MVHTRGGVRRSDFARERNGKTAKLLRNSHAKGACSNSPRKVALPFCRFTSRAFSIGRRLAYALLNHHELVRDVAEALEAVFGDYAAILDAYAHLTW